MTFTCACGGFYTGRSPFFGPRVWEVAVFLGRRSHPVQGEYRYRMTAEITWDIGCWRLPRFHCVCVPGWWEVAKYGDDRSAGGAR